MRYQVASPMRSSRRRVGFAGFRRVCLLAAAVAAAIAGVSPASAQSEQSSGQSAEQLTVQVSGSQADGFGRIELLFDEEIPVSAEARNGVLVVNFGGKVSVGQQRLAEQMPGYVSVVRADPDGTGMRVALTQNFRANVLEAGERVFIDLLPERWAGLPPGLPTEVVAELARRAREAEAMFLSDRARRLAAETQDMPVRVAELPTLVRLIFEPPGFTPITERLSEDGLELRFDEPLRLAAERPLGALPGIRVAEEEQSEGSLFVRIFLDEGYSIRGFHEERNYVVDIEPNDLASPAGEAELAEDAAEVPSPPRRDDEGGAVAMSEVVDAVRETDAATIARELARPEPLAEATGFGQVTSEGLRISFSFGEEVPAAAFVRAGTARAVFHTKTPLAVAPLPRGAEAYASLDAVVREGDFVTVRLDLPEQNIVRLFPEGGGWVLLVGDIADAAALPLTPVRELDDSGRNVLLVPLADASGVLWLDEPDTGERLAIVTAPGEARNIAKLQRFVEMQLLPTAHGLAISALADDIQVRPEFDHVAIARGSGLTLSLPEATEPRTRNALPDNQLITREGWDALRRGQIRERERAFIGEVLEAPPSGRMAARVDLAKFLIANDLAPEGNAVLNFIANEDLDADEDRRFALLKAIARIDMQRYADARAALSAPFLEEDAEAQLWRAYLAALEERWQVALVGFRRARMLLDSYPDVLQGEMRMAAIRAALALNEYPFVERELSHLALLSPGSVPRDELDLLTARFDMAMGRPEAAMAVFERIMENGARPHASEAQWRWIQEAVANETISVDDAIARLETLAVSWRGDEVEIEAIGQLGRLYASQGRWRDAFLATRSANLFFPDHPVSQALHEETAQIFNDLFLGGLAEGLGRVDAVSLFFDFRDFLPIGRRGDEIVRRLADRLVELDLLDKAAELLRHQVDNRLQGAARSTVAARLATVYLMENNPVEALQVLRETRLPELPSAIKRARMLLEARALSDLTRTDLALEVLDGEEGIEVDRLRADIYWTGRRWRDAGEAHEQLLATRWQEAEPLSERERTDVLRAAIAYTLGDEPIGLDRLRAKFIAQMTDSEDARIFALVTTPGVASTDAFRDIAKRVTSADTLFDFLEAYRERYPDAAISARPPSQGLREPQPMPEPSEEEGDGRSAMGTDVVEPSPRG
jgi:tetratricopeptide (TPR) repeat protein